ncbi:MAG: hypothetical protein KGS72_20435 [Cyanobacteria bacterium REEB67]|nr:hypothetical protein [Cyanobacteria bacterium REEB67]
MISGTIPTFAFAQSNQSTNPYDSASMPSQARLNGSVTQSTSNGNGSMRMTRSQSADTAGSNQTSDSQGSLFSSSALSSFGSSPSPAAPNVQSSQSGNMSGIVNQSAAIDGSNNGASSSYSGTAGSAGSSPLAGGSQFDFGKALSLGTTMFNGLNRLMNDNRTPAGSVFSGSSQMSGGLLNRSTITNAGTSLLNGSAGQFFKIAKPLTRNEINLLSNYDVAIVIDKSGSMQSQDCPGGLSRWDFCREQLLNLTSQVNTAFRSGITVALFSSEYHIFNNVSFSMVPEIFATNSPDGGTYLARPMRDIFFNFFNTRDRNMITHTPTRPLLIEVVTDGEPSDKEALIQVICDATQKMTSPHEVSIQFLQIGHEFGGSRVLNELDNRLVGEDGAQYDIVNVEPFNQVISEGLARSMVAVATNHP